MNIVLFDTEENFSNLLPLSFTRPVSSFRMGILTIAEKWRYLLPGDYVVLPMDYLREKYYDGRLHDKSDALYISANVLPDARLAVAVDGLAHGQALRCDRRLLAYRGSYSDFKALRPVEEEDQPAGYVKYAEADFIDYVFDVFRHNRKAVTDDFRMLVAGRRSMPLSETNTLVGGYEDKDGFPTIFIEEGAVVEGAVINVKEGPVYIGKDAEVMEGACLRGPVALCQSAKVKMGGKVYGATTLGPCCKVGGELSNVVMFGYSNKAHEGYLGNAVIGEWCNIGAGTSASNLKNDYSRIRIWNYASHTFMRTDLQFCGLIMGDHSKAGINCMFNTATVLGVGVNVHGSGFPRTFIPSFSEGSPAAGFADVSLKKFFDIADRVMSRRGITLDDAGRRVYEHVYAMSQNYK